MIKCTKTEVLEHFYMCSNELYYHICNDKDKNILASICGKLYYGDFPVKRLDSLKLTIHKNDIYCYFSDCLVGDIHNNIVILHEQFQNDLYTRAMKYNMTICISKLHISTINRFIVKVYNCNVERIYCLTHLLGLVHKYNNSYNKVVEYLGKLNNKIPKRVMEYSGESNKLPNISIKDLSLLINDDFIRNIKDFVTKFRLYSNSYYDEEFINKFNEIFSLTLSYNDILKGNIIKHNNIRFNIVNILNYNNIVKGTGISLKTYLASCNDNIKLCHVLKNVKDEELRTLILNNSINDYIVKYKLLDVVKEYNDTKYVKTSELHKDYMSFVHDLQKSYTKSYSKWILEGDDEEIPNGNIPVKVSTFENYKSDGKIKTFKYVSTKPIYKKEYSSLFKYAKIQEVNRILTDSGLTLSENYFIYLFNNFNTLLRAFEKENSIYINQWTFCINNRFRECVTCVDMFIKDAVIIIQNDKKCIVTKKDLLYFITECESIYKNNNHYKFNEFIKFKNQLYV